MRTIGRWIGELLLSLLRGFLIVGGIGLVGGIALVYASTRALPNTGEWFLIVALTVVAGLFGATVALAWRLSHLGQLRQLGKQPRRPEHGSDGQHGEA
jgi:hypothetical protein